MNLPSLLPMIVGCSFASGAEDPPSMRQEGLEEKAEPLLLLDRASLERSRSSLAGADSPLREAAERLKEDAVEARAAGPFSVVHKERLAPSGDPHDYRSFGPYWWPDPSKPGGEPYLRKDGKVNPETRDGTASDSRRRSQLFGAVEVLSLSWFLFGAEEDAEHAARLLRVWFLDPATRMNPHLQYGQAIPGRVEGRGIGIIDTRHLVRLSDHASLLRASKAWTAEDHAGLKAWCAAYLDWLCTSAHGKDEAATRNNHATWYDVQVAGLALFVGQPERARSVLQAAIPRRVATQLQPDGRQPHELARTKSFDYSVMNLAGFFALARLGEHVQVDLWSDVDEDGRGLRSALAYLLQTEDWPHPQIGAIRRDRLLPLLLEAARVGLLDDAAERAGPWLRERAGDRVRLWAGR